jgi:hypothetical protein
MVPVANSREWIDTLRRCVVHVGCSVEWTRVDGTTVELSVGAVCDTHCVVLLLRVLVLDGCRLLVMCRQYVGL